MLGENGLLLASSRGINGKCRLLLVIGLPGDPEDFITILTRNGQSFLESGNAYDVSSGLALHPSQSVWKVLR